jgi:MFS family permease
MAGFVRERCAQAPEHMATGHPRRLLGLALHVAAGPQENGFRRFWLSLAITMFGTWAGAVALTVRLYDQTHSTTWSSLLYVAEFAPTVFIGILFGRLLDRLPPVRALAVFELTAAATWLILVVVDAPPIVVMLAVVNGACAGAYKIIATSATSMLVSEENLDAANAATLSIDNLMTLAGYAIGGVLIGATAPEFVLGLNAVTFLVSAILLFTLPSIAAPRHDGMPHESWWHQITAGARRMAGHPRLRVVLVALPVATAAVGMGNALTIPLLRGAVAASAAAIGFVLATHAFGLVFGAWAGPFLPKRTATFLLGMVVMGAGMFPMMFSSSIALIAAGILVSGFGNGVVIIRFRTTMQMSTAPEDRASTIAFIYSFSFGVGVLGAALAGPTANLLDLRSAIAVTVGLFMLAALAGAVTDFVDRRRYDPVTSVAGDEFATATVGFRGHEGRIREFDPAGGSQVPPIGR